MSVLCELGLFRFIEAHGRIIVNNVGIVHATPRLVGPEIHLRRILLFIHRAAPVTLEEKRQIWLRCIEIWDPVIEFSDQLWAVMDEGVPDSILALIEKNH